MTRRREIFLRLGMCRVDASGRLEARPREHAPFTVFVRSLRGQLRSRSHFITWVTDRLVQLPVFSGVRQARIPVRDEPR